MSTALAVLVVLAVAGGTFVRGLGWGLPSHEADRWLFGDRPVWSGREIIEKLAARNADSLSPVPGGEGTGSRGADVDADPIVDRSNPIVLNDTDAKRAAIVQRYRLMSGQPDEFIQFKALAEMSQRKGLARFDPRLYQYGGLWIYPVGALIRGAIAMNLIERPSPDTSAREFYLDRPDAFGSFYAIARGYSAAWGVAAALGVFVIARGVTTSRWLGAAAAIAFVLLPVVQTAAHEAKPHLAGAALCLLAVLPATRFVEDGRRRWLIAAAALCGASMGMVVSMVVSLAILPTMVWQRARLEKKPLPRTRGRGQAEGVVTGGALNACELPVTTPSPEPSPPITGERELSVVASLVLGLLVAVAVYFATNPFVLLNAIRAPQLLRSNFGNSTAMYGVHGTFSIVTDVVRIAGHAMTPIGARVALAACITTLIARRSRPARSSSAFESLLFPTALVALQFVLLAAGKPAEYARFGLVMFAAACVAGAIAVRNLLAAPKYFGPRLIPVLLLCTLIPPLAGRRAFDAWQWDESDQTALQLDTMRQLGHQPPGETYRLGVAYEPAPWSSPPPNLFEQEVVLVRMSPAMLNEVDAVVWPVNLESQLFDRAHDRESLDWRDPRWGVRAESREGEPDRWRGGW